MYKITLSSHDFSRSFEGIIKRDYNVHVLNDDTAPWGVTYIASDKQSMKLMVADHWGQEDLADFEDLVSEVRDYGYQVEFPDFELDVEIPYGFRDVSWHNDACPSWACKLPDATNIRIWIDYKDRKKGDFGDVPADEYHRFMLCLYDHEMEPIQDLVHTNDWAEIELQARFQVMKAEVIAAMQEGQVPRTVRSIGELREHADTNALGGFCEDGYPAPRDADGNLTEEHQDFHIQCLAELSNWLRRLTPDFDPGPHVDLNAVALDPKAAEAVKDGMVTEGKMSDSHVYMQVDAPATSEAWVNWLTWDHAKRVRFEMYQQLRKEFENAP